MGKLSSGEFFGVTNQRLDTEGIILTRTAYTHDYVDWHHHENAYFTFILSGKVIEGNKKGKNYLSAGSLLFHNAQESHYNIKPKGNTYGMHLEIQSNWMEKAEPSWKTSEGSFEISSPKTRMLFYKLLKESNITNGETDLGIKQLSIEIMDSLSSLQSCCSFRPPWLKQVEDLLSDTYLNPPDLTTMAKIIGVHPVHLSRSFSRYIGCTMSVYVRRIKVNMAISQLSITNNSLSSIAYRSGFADQSHMIRCFKEVSGDTPSYFRKLINSFPKS